MATKIENLRSGSGAVLSLTTNSPVDASLAVPKTDVAPGGRIPVLDGLRGIAILSVMVGHFWLVGTGLGHTLWERLYAQIAGRGWAGVDLFFVLSGFLITGILYDSRSNPHYYRVFYARRTVRIFPLYYAFLALFCVLVPFVLRLLHHPELVPGHDTTTTKLFAWSYTLNWYVGFKGYQVVSYSIQHFWSLCIEEQFYFAWPFFVLTLMRRRLMGLCGGLMALAFVLRAVLLRLGLASAAYAWTFSRTDSLAIGALVALAARNPQDWKRIVSWASRLTLPALCGAAILMALETLRPGFMSQQFFLFSFEYSLVGIFCGGCMALALCTNAGSLTNKSLSSPFLRFFGKYSYCLYICHLPLIVLGAKMGLHSDRLTTILGNKFLAIVSVNAVAFALAIVIALASWNLFEKHFLKLKDLHFCRA